MDRWAGGEQAYRWKETDFHIFSSLLSRERASLCSSQNIFKLFLHFHYFTVSLFHFFTFYFPIFFAFFNFFFTASHFFILDQTDRANLLHIHLFVYLYICTLVFFFIFFMPYLHTKSPFFSLPSILVFFLSTISFQSYQQIVFSLFFSLSWSSVLPPRGSHCLWSSFFTLGGFILQSVISYHL